MWAPLPCPRSWRLQGHPNGSSPPPHHLSWRGLENDGSARAQAGRVSLELAPEHKCKPHAARSHVHCGLNPFYVCLPESRVARAQFTTLHLRHLHWRQAAISLHSLVAKEEVKVQQPASHVGMHSAIDVQATHQPIKQSSAQFHTPAMFMQCQSRGAAAESHSQTD
jgi:hypothetical protein